MHETSADEWLNLLIIGASLQHENKHALGKITRSLFYSKSGLKRPLMAFRTLIFQGVKRRGRKWRFITVSPPSSCCCYLMESAWCVSVCHTGELCVFVIRTISQAFLIKMFPHKKVEKKKKSSFNNRKSEKKLAKRNLHNFSVRCVHNLNCQPTCKLNYIAMKY